jgi:hypothetical protein
MEERAIEHYEGKVLAAAGKWCDARLQKSDERRKCDLALANAVTDLRARLAKVPKPP